MMESTRQSIHLSSCSTISLKSSKQKFIVQINLMKAFVRQMSYCSNYLNGVGKCKISQSDTSIYVV